MPSKSYKLSRGYTFIEILAVTAIFSSMMIIAVATFSVAASQETVVSNRRLVHQSAKIGVDSMIRRLAVSKNQYDEDGTLPKGGGAFVITKMNNLNLLPTNQSDGSETVGDSLIIRTIDKAGAPVYHAYFLCQHAYDTAAYSLVMQNLGSAKNFDNDWNNIKAALPAVSQCPAGNNLEQITTADVKIPAGGFSISGYFPEAGLLTQPRITVTLTAQNTKGTRAEERVWSTYRATAVHRDYGQY